MFRVVGFDVALGLEVVEGVGGGFEDFGGGFGDEG